MEIKFDVTSNLEKALAQFTTLRERDLPFVAITAVNMTLKQVKADIRDEMTRVFDKPVPFTLNSLQTYPFATKEDPTAVLRFRDFAGKGTPAKKYLQPEIYGGGRGYKSFEKALSSAGILPQGMYAVPAEAGGPANKGAPLDQYGNIRGAYLNRMLSYLRANRDATQNRNNDRKGKRGSRRGMLQWYAVTEEGGRLPTGIYERQAGVMHMVIKFTRAPAYEVKLDFHKVAQASAEKHIGPNVKRAADIALKALARQGAQWSIADLLSLAPKTDA